MIRRTLLPLALLLVLTAPPAARAAGEFGFAGKGTATPLGPKGALERQAGAHPFSYTVHFELKTDEKGFTEGGELRDLLIDVPPGLVGNPQAVPTCPRQDFEGGVPQCKPATQVGVLRVIVPSGIGEALGPIYNLAPPPGSPLQLGFETGGFQSLQTASLLPDAGYAARIAAPNAPLELSEATATIWGVPADPRHTHERGPVTPGDVPSEAPLLPFLTLPSSCGPPPVLTIRANSKLDPGTFATEEVPLREAGLPVGLQGCEAVPFKPAVSAAPTTQAAGSPSGLGFELKLPNEGLTNPADGAIAETEPVKTEVTLPAGITANPAAAGGLGACAPGQYKAAACPDSSKLGTLTAHTPLLDEAIEGSLYLASPHDNPFGSLLALYLIARAPERGILVKQAGVVHADPASGRLTTVFDNLPPLPYSSFEVRLREGPRAPLITPRTCGAYRTTARLYPFSAPSTPVVKTAPFTISSGAAAGPCAASEAQLPNDPSLAAGTTVPLGGAYAPFLFKASREDGSQLFSSLSATLPPGLTGKLAGIPYCPESGIAQAQSRSFEGAGAAELASPSCPAASQVGTVTAAAGAGSSPYYVQGTAYLAGPYKGAPLSLAIVTPALAGPFDLGVVTVRAAVRVNETTAQIGVQSDPLPTILQGIPLEVRSAAVSVDRERFTLNPTDCEPLSVTGALTSTLGATAPLKDPFQVGGCRNLPYGPQLRLSFKGRARRTAHPKVIATLTAREGEANTRFAQVKLPRAAFLDQAHIRTVCTRVQFAAGEGNGAQCPKGSIYGRATARTPLLDYPLPGTVYLRSSSHELPDLVVAFHGPPSQPIKFALAGVTDAVKGALRNTFHSAPDVPVESFRLELFGGKRGLVVLSSGLCAHPAATARFKGHNGREYTARPKVTAACGKRGPARGQHRRANHVHLKLRG